MSSSTRLYHLDNLRVALTVLVIAHHVGQAYGPTGGWWPVQEAERAAVLGPFFTVNRSFFMSLFFMISGYLMVGAWDRSTPRRFVLGRLRRLGIPALVWALGMIPLRVFLFGERISRWVDVMDVAHLWYIEHVLLFSLVYALLRRLRPVAAGQNDSPLPRLPAILALALFVAFASALVRVWYPIDLWLNLFGFFRVAFADVPRDLTLFVVGALAYRRGWFERYPARAGFAWLAVGVLAAAAWYVFALALRGYPAVMTAVDLAYPFWEAILCFGLCIGLLVLFREGLGGQGALARFLAENQYSAYFWHPLLIVAMQMLLVGIPLAPIPKFAMLTAAGSILVFLWSALLRRVPAVRAVL